MKHTAPPRESTVPTTASIVYECDLPHAPALVWRALTERELLAAWLLPNDLRPEVGARFTFKPGPREQPGDRQAGDGLPADREPGDGRDRGQAPRSDATIDCEVLEVETNRTLRWRQTEYEETDSGRQTLTSVVTINLTDNTAGGTHLRLVHDAFTIAAATATEPAVAPRACASVTPIGFRSAKLRNRTSIVCQLRRAA
jgi:uncharacterized protein YndB with AHSA1/START domain